MKISITLLLFICIVHLKTQAQSIGINSTGEKPDPSAMLDVKSITGGLLFPRMTYNQMNAIANPAAGLMVYVTIDDPGLHVFDGTSWRLVRAAGGNDNLWYSPNGHDIVSLNTGNVGINTTSANNHLQIGSDGGYSGADFVVGNGTGAMAITEYSNITYLAATNNLAINVGNGAGRVGVNLVENPTNAFQIGATHDYTDYDFAIGRNNQSMAIYQGPNFTNWSATDNMTINPKNGTGYVGINVGSNPANKLQIGSVGSTGFATNDLAIGNGTNAFAIFQTNASTLMGSTTDMILMPRNNGAGKIGINTNTPRAPLEVSGFTVLNSSYNYVSRLFDNTDIGDCEECTPQTSIYSQFGILASEFDAYSDARIKNIVGVSNTSSDLHVIDSIQITDYTYKDSIKYGQKRSKKVIAQQVEKFFPQIVNRHTDFVPNVYQMTSGITQVAGNYLLTFTNKHNITASAKKLQLMVEDSLGMQQVAILNIPNPNQVLISTPTLKSNKVFVYGEEVSDFRTVDYEGLTTLNISATQELSKLVKRQEALLRDQQKEMEILEKRLAALETKTIDRHRKRSTVSNRDLSKN